MKVYLVRHGDAVVAEHDVHRPLSDKGRIEVEKVAHFLQKNEIFVERIFHSEKLRAGQTAEILAKGLKHAPAIESLNGLLPDDSVQPIAVCCNHWQNDVMLVSHLPFLPKLVCELILGYDNKLFTDFQTAGILCMERNGLFDWTINWMVNPKILG